MDSELEWLVRRQEDDGSWPARREAAARSATANAENSRSETGYVARFGVTGLAVLAILSDGRTGPGAEGGLYREALDKGLAWLVRHSHDAAQLPIHVDRAWGALALVDAAALSDDAELRAAARRVCEVLAKTPWDEVGPDTWHGACASMFVLVVAWHADLGVDPLVDAALEHIEELFHAKPDGVRSAPLLYLVARLGISPRPDPGVLKRYFDAPAEAERIPVAEPIPEEVLFDVWHHIACVDGGKEKGKGIPYRGRGGYKRTWQLLETDGEGFGTTSACVERRTAEAILLLLRPYKLLSGVSRDQPTRGR